MAHKTEVFGKYSVTQSGDEPRHSYGLNTYHRSFVKNLFINKKGGKSE
jgi:hypothetical protein